MDRIIAVPAAFEGIGESIESANYKFAGEKATRDLGATVLREACSALQFQGDEVENIQRNQATQTRDQGAGDISQGAIGLAGEAGGFLLETVNTSQMNDVEQSLQNPKGWSEAINEANVPEDEPEVEVLPNQAIQKTDDQIRTQFATKNGNDTIRRFEDGPQKGQLNDPDAIADLKRYKVLDPDGFDKFSEDVKKNVTDKDKQLSNLQESRFSTSRRLSNVSQNLGSVAQAGAKFQLASDQEAGAKYQKAEKYAQMMLEMEKGLYQELIQQANRMSSDTAQMIEAMMNRTMQAGHS